MCAINGISWKDEKLVALMNEKSKHRGPDGTGVFGGVLGHNRLAIIDLDERASQPMEGSRHVISFNGEIYNYKELREELGGHEFKTESDTEVILAGYERWGKEVFSRLNGIFTISIVDKETGETVLARDPVGIKPLYMYEGEKGVAFSSEIKSLLLVSGERKLNKKAFDAYMHTLYVPAPDTLFFGISKFPSGHVGVIKDGKLSVEKFSYRAVGERGNLKDVVCRAVKRQMVSDRPLGIYLSGGIDSSSVLACAKETGADIHTYSIGFALSDEEESEKFNADAKLAKKISEHFGATHHEFFIKPTEVIDLFKKAVFHLDEPIANATIAPQVALSGFVKDTATVVLTGDGGDEVFAGYPRHLMARRMNFVQKFIPSFLLRLLPGKLGKLGVSDVKDQFALFHFQKEMGRVLAENAIAPSLVKDGDSLLDADRKTWLVDEALMRSDKLAMANAVESRAPLLDLEVLDFAKDFPFEKQVTLFDTKVLLKKAFASVLPSWVIKQPKRGWFSPGAKWLRHKDLVKELEEILSPEYHPGTKELFNWSGVQEVFTEHKEKRGYHAPLLLALVMFQLWAKEFDIEYEK